MPSMHMAIDTNTLIWKVTTADPWYKKEEA